MKHFSQIFLALCLIVFAAPGAFAADKASESSQQLNKDVEDIASLLQPYVYEARGRRDIFAISSRHYFESESPKKVSTDRLLNVDISEVTLIGVIWNYRSPRAFVKMSNGDVREVALRDKIGNKQGYIAAIRESEVVILEKESKRGKLVYVPKIKEIDTTGR